MNGGARAYAPSLVVAVLTHESVMLCVSLLMVAKNVRLPRRLTLATFIHAQLAVKCRPGASGVLALLHVGTKHTAAGEQLRTAMSHTVVDVAQRSRRRATVHSDLHAWWIVSCPSGALGHSARAVATVGPDHASVRCLQNQSMAANVARTKMNSRHATHLHALSTVSLVLPCNAARAAQAVVQALRNASTV